MPVRIVLQAGGSSEEFTLRKILEYYGYTYDDVNSWGAKVLFVGYAEEINMFKDRHVGSNCKYDTPCCNV